MVLLQRYDQLGNLIPVDCAEVGRTSSREKGFDEPGHIDRVRASVQPVEAMDGSAWPLVSDELVTGESEIPISLERLGAHARPVFTDISREILVHEGPGRLIEREQ